MSAENKVPAIRFEGFSGEWEGKALGEMGLFKNGMNFDKSAMGHGYPFVNLQDVFGRNEVSSDNLGLAFSTVSQRKEYSLESGDVLFIRSSVKPEGVGEAAVMLKSLADTTYSGFIIRFRPALEMDVNFNRFVYATAGSRKQILASSTSSANSNINQDALKKVQINLPSKTEQTKIGQYFQQLDTLIAQHQQKHDKLLNLKKALLDKLFPKQGTTEPALRFKGFSGAWEEKVLGDLGNVVTGSTPSTQNETNYSKNGMPWVTPTDIKENVTFHTARYLSSHGQKEGRVVPKDTILVTCIASIGKNTLLGTEGSFNQQINGLIPFQKENSPYFLFSESYLWSEKMKRTAAAGTMQIVNKSEFSAIRTPVPKFFKEQTKIGTLFKKIDTLITQHQTQLKKLGNIKQACLEKMFV